MELPSMVQRSGDKLIVRSVVSGNQLYLDQGANSANSNANNASNTRAHSPSPNNLQQQQHQHCNNSTSALEQQLERYRVAAAQQQHHYMQQQQQQQNASQQQQAAALELKDEGLPQCKIKRNYSCSYCTYFTQNPRYHLTHLRDVHGEKIVINKCKLCLYASRHFQKLVRHMKMVHGCTDGIAGTHGQARGKRGMSREARKRKLEQSVGIGSGGPVGGGASAGAVGSGVPEMPTFEQVKRELELQEQKLQLQAQTFNKHQDAEQKHQQQLANNAAIFAVAYERQLQAQRDRDLEALQARNAYEQNASAAVAATEVAQRRHSPPTHNNSSTGFQMPPAHQPQIANRNLDLTPSPTGSSSPSNRGTPLSSIAVAGTASGGALSLSYAADEPAQNRLLKCSICDFTTLYRADLVDHELQDHCKTKFFRCEKCSYVTHIKARFSKHVKYHSMPMIKCVTCDFRTPYKWNLDRHMKNHGGAGPFKCAACDFTADIKQSLTVHEMNHHVPPVGHAAGMSLARRRNKVGGTDLCDDFLSDSAELLEDHYNNNNLDEYDEALLVGGGAVVVSYGKKCKYDDDEPTDLSQKGGSSDTSSVHNHSLNALTPKAKRPVPNLIPIPKVGSNVLNLSKDLAASRSSLSEIASIFFNEKQLSEMLQPLDKSDAAQLSPTTTITSTTSSHNSRSLLQKRTAPSFFDKLKSSALASGGPNENLICPCGHVAKCLSESIIHRKTCNFAAIADDDIEEEQDDTYDRLEIDFADEEDKQSHSALNLSVTGSTRCQHCRHRCKSSADLLNHLKQCSEAGRCGNESYDSLSGESSAGRAGADSMGGDQQHPMENRVFIWNKMPRSGGTGAGREGSHSSESGPQGHNGGGGDSAGGSGTGSASNEENSYYGVETAPGYGEVTKKMTPEEEAANSSLKKVYKCPHCSFWASTASRFHVHIVGHLNKKPFECSLCSYRSNWRWDITKHIRLKTIRDPSHKNARVLMNDETGRRNYTKYNKYITLMKVTEEDGDPKLMKSGEMTPNQVASLAFLNDFNKSVNATSAGGTSSAHLNGIKEDITLEPIGSNKSTTDGGGAGTESQLSEGFIRLPILATMMNAAMVQQQQQQQQHQKEHEQQHTAMITPSVTISAVKRSPPPLMKPSDDLVTDVRQEGNEKKTFYKCRKCNFRHTNRDAVLAHVKIHYQDPTYPIITATATTSPKSSSTTPLQVAVNSTNMYMNKVLAAMCLSQQQQNSNSSSNNHQQQQHSILSAGLLQQAIQGASPNSPLGGLALALAGKSPAKAATASILEHGEQKANHNEASAQRPPASPTIVNSNNSNSNKNSNAVCLPSSVSLLSGGSLHNNSSSGMVVGVHSQQQQQPPPPPSLQHLLTSPRGTYAITQQHTHHNHQQQQQQHQTNSSSTTTTFAGIGTTNNNNNNLVMGGGSHLVGSGTATTTTTTRTETAFKSPTAATLPTSSSSPSSLLNCTTATSTIVTTISNTSTTTNSCNPNMQMGIIGGVSSSSSSSSVIVGASKSNINNNNNSNPNSKNIINGGGSGGGGGEHFCIGGVIYGSNNSTLNCNITSTSAPSHLSSATTATTNSCNLLLSSAPPNATTANRNASSSSSPPSSSSSATNLNINSNNNNINNNSNSNNNCNLLSNDNDRRDPSPYRCGHCHQVSNWKHVIQRHCRLKHGGDIRIETLDRSAINERGQSACIYRPLGNGGGGGNCGVGTSGIISSNETNYGLTLKALQQHQQQQHQSGLNTSNNNNNNPILMNKNEHLQHSPIAAATAAAASATAANTPQDLQAAAHAYLAAYKAAAANAGAGVGGVGVGVGATTAVGDDMLLQQQLQQNDQIEITRLPATTVQQNSKCKQQKCPLCPYISESKSQMNYHISLHKPTQYECPLCTFVCAKKQHLSSHMRSLHQQHNSGIAGNGNGGGVNSGGVINLDFSVALQFAAAAQAQQETSSSSSLTTPLAIDLTPLKHFPNASHLAVAAAQQLQQRLQNEHQNPNQTKTVYHCAKCPVRFAQKNDSNEASIYSKAKTELKEHLKFHHGVNGTMYKCEFCDFKAAHETVIQTHRHVHTQHYQDMCKELYRMCKESVEYAAPKLMQITLAKNLQTQTPETIWIVDNDLSGEQMKQQHHQQQNSSISSSSVGASNFDNANSLLKKQLESGPAPLSATATSAARHSPSPKVLLQECGDDDSSNTHSTSASIATSDLAAELAGSDIASSAASPAPPLEKCLHCPYETKNASSYKSHLQHHICVSNQMEAFTCEHCDYTNADKCNIGEHTRLHFNAMAKLKSVAFFTKYDKLELSIEQDQDDDDEDDVGEGKEKAAAQDRCNENENDCKVQQTTLHIKQEEEHSNKHNNNNEEHVLNENTLQEEQQQQQKENSKTIECEEESISPATATSPNPPPPPPLESIKKIILYKNDGCLSIKRDTSSTATAPASASATGDNISDRLRRRISRSSNNNYMNASNNNNNDDHHNHNHNQQQQQQQQQNQPQQQQSHKTILVNAKTGQVISRN